jgi:hypothetical protein
MSVMIYRMPPLTNQALAEPKEKRDMSSEALQSLAVKEVQDSSGRICLDVILCQGYFVDQATACRPNEVAMSIHAAATEPRRPE